jgi:3D (Asp-Asp-Asp) domain-containing protein
MVAADWKVLPQGTRILIEGHGEAVVEDAGGGIKGNRIDIYMDKHEEAVQFGRKVVRVREIE